MSPNDKSRLLGLFFWLFTALNVFIVAVIAVVYIVLFGAIFSQIPQKAGDPPPEMFVGILIVAFAIALIFTVLFSVPKVIAGYGLRNNKPWARGWAIASSIMCCLSFPIGTAIGVFGLIFLFSDEGKLYFEDRAQGRIGSSGILMPPPPPNSWQ